MSEMNLNVESYQVNDQTKNLKLINPNEFPVQDINSPQVPVLLRTESKKCEVSNMPYDEVAVLEETSTEEAGETERTAEDTYDLAFTKNILEKFPNIYPPEPPKSEINNSEIIENMINNDNKFYAKKINEFEDRIGDGKFEYVSDTLQREMLVNAWQAITFTNNWHFVAEEIGSFTWSTDPRINQISRKMEELGYTGHSGCSFGCTMRNMQYLAQHGESKFKELYEENEPESKPKLEPYEQRLNEVIKRVENKKAEDKLLEYMGGY